MSFYSCFSYFFFYKDEWINFAQLQSNIKGWWLDGYRDWQGEDGKDGSEGGDESTAEEDDENDQKA